MITSVINGAGMKWDTNGIKRLIGNTFKQLDTYGCRDLVHDYLGASLVVAGSTLIHELGHAVMSKILFGSPIDITLGTSDMRKNPYLQLGGIKLGGFNPYKGFAMTMEPLEEQTVAERGKPMTNYRLSTKPEHRKKMIAVLAAGPICGALASLAAYCFLKKHNKFVFSKFISLRSLYSSSIGLFFYLGKPTSDIAKIISLLRG